MKLFSYQEIIDDADDFVIYLDDDIEIEGVFTNARVDRDSLPDGKYAYDLTEGSEGFESIEEFVVVNHGGTFICDEPIVFGEEKYISLGEYGDADYSFL